MIFHTRTRRTRRKRSRPVQRRRNRPVIKRKKVRLAIECTLEERKYMKMLAAHEEMTLNELILDSVKMRFKECPFSHVPNKKTEAVLRRAEKKKDLISFDSVEDFLKSLEK